MATKQAASANRRLIEFTSCMDIGSLPGTKVARQTPKRWFWQSVDNIQACMRWRKSKGWQDGPRTVAGTNCLKPV